MMLSEFEENNTTLKQVRTPGYPGSMGQWSFTRGVGQATEVIQYLEDESYI